MPYDPEYGKIYREKNKEKIRQRKREWKKSPAGKKRRRIDDWKKQGILCFDWDLLYDLFLSTNKCEYCGIELKEGNKCDGKCLDHDHSITDRFNIRGVLCRKCNFKDVLK